MVRIRMSRSVVSALLCLAAIVSSAAVRAAPVSSFSGMPDDAIGFTSLNSTVLQQTMHGQGITARFLDLSPTEWSGSFTSWSGFSPGNVGSDIAPSGSGGLRNAVQFTFDQPVYAVGGTVFASPFSFGDSSAGFVSRNIGNPLVTLTAFDSFSNVIEQNSASNYGTVNGPSAILNAGTGNEVMSSFVGIWSSTPILQVTFIGAVNVGAQGTAYFSNLASFSYSRTPFFGPVISPIPEPETYAMLLAGLGVLVLATRRKRQPSVRKD